MATVRITKDLCSQVERMARHKFDAKIQKITEDHPGTTEWADTIYDRIFGKYYAQMISLPREFFDYTTELRIETVGPHRLSKELQLSSERPLPRRLPEDAPVSMTWNNAFNLINDLVWEDFITEVAAWSDRVSAVRKQADEFVEGVMAVLNAHSTLAPALKAWPPLWDLLPEHTKDKHKEIVERKKPEKEQVDTDVLNKLTATVAASKLGGL